MVRTRTLRLDGRPYGNYPRILVALGSSHGVVNQFAAERNTQELSIRYVSGLCNQKPFAAISSEYPATIRIDSRPSQHLDVATPKTQSDAIDGFSQAHLSVPIRSVPIWITSTTCLLPLARASVDVDHILLKRYRFDRRYFRS
jgi:hypothetical protein